MVDAIPSSRKYFIYLREQIMTNATIFRLLVITLLFTHSSYCFPSESNAEQASRIKALINLNITRLKDNDSEQVEMLLRSRAEAVCERFPKVDEVIKHCNTRFFREYEKIRNMARFVNELALFDEHKFQNILTDGGAIQFCMENENELKGNNRDRDSWKRYYSAIDPNKHSDMTWSRIVGCRIQTVALVEAFRTIYSRALVKKRENEIEQRLAETERAVAKALLDQKMIYEIPEIPQNQKNQNTPERTKTVSQSAAGCTRGPGGSKMPRYLAYRNSCDRKVIVQFNQTCENGRVTSTTRFLAPGQETEVDILMDPNCKPLGGFSSKMEISSERFE